MESSDIHFRTPLAIAAGDGQPQSTVVLVARGAVIDTRDEEGCTPLMLACRRGQPRCTELLAALGSSVNAINRAGFSPLALACRHGDARSVAVLLRYGADVSQPERRTGCTPLMIACQHGEVACAAALLAGKRLDVRRRRGSSRHGARGSSVKYQKRGKPGAQLLLGSTWRTTMSAQQLVEVDPDGRAALTWACYYGHSTCATLLLNHGADVRAPDRFGKSPIENWPGVLAKSASLMEAGKALLVVAIARTFRRRLAAVRLAEWQHRLSVLVRLKRREKGRGRERERERERECVCVYQLVPISWEREEQREEIKERQRKNQTKRQKISSSTEMQQRRCCVRLGCM